MFESLAKRFKLDRGGADDELEWVQPAEDVLRIYFVHDPDDVLDEAKFAWEDRGFVPEFTHQLFGQDEKVKGYKGLQIKVALHSFTLHAYVKIAYEQKRPGADDVRHFLKENIGLHFTEDAAEFTREVRSSATSIEEALRSDACTSRTHRSRSGDPCQIVRFRPAEVNELRAWHDRYQALPLLFIDGANYIDNEDSRWDVFVYLTNSGSDTKEGRSDRAQVAGFCTVYSFYAYPERKRLRLSQILVFPPHRHKGVASSMLTEIYEFAAHIGALDVTVEDPSEDFQLIRERVDLQRLFGAQETLKAIQKELREIADGAIHVPKKWAYDRAESELKIHKAQFRKVWELLVFKILGKASARRLVEKRLHNDESGQKDDRKAVVDMEPPFGTGGFIMKRWPFQMSHASADLDEKVDGEGEDAAIIETRMTQIVTISNKL